MKRLRVAGENYTKRTVVHLVVTSKLQNVNLSKTHQLGRPDHSDWMVIQRNVENGCEVEDDDHDNVGDDVSIWL